MVTPARFLQEHIKSLDIIQCYNTPEAGEAKKIIIFEVSLLNGGQDVLRKANISSDAWFIMDITAMAAQREIHMIRGIRAALSNYGFTVTKVNQKLTKFGAKTGWVHVEFSKLNVPTSTFPWNILTNFSILITGDDKEIGAATYKAALRGLSPRLLNETAIKCKK